MAYKRKTWKEKLHNGLTHKTVRNGRKYADVPEGAMLFIPTPEIVDEYIRSIPLGTHTTIQQMRNDLAAEYHTEFTCPITAGIFLRIASEAAYEDYTAGTPIEDLTPFWRMIDKKAPVAKKLTFGTEFVKEQREKEGLTF